MRWKRQDDFWMRAMRELEHPIISGEEALGLVRTKGRIKQPKGLWPVLLEYHGKKIPVKKHDLPSVERDMRIKTKRVGRKSGGKTEWTSFFGF